MLIAAIARGASMQVWNARRADLFATLSVPVALLLSRSFKICMCGISRHSEDRPEVRSMLIEARARFEFPAFSEYLERAGRSAANTGQIVAGLMHFGEMTEQRVHAVLTGPIPPIVGVAALNGIELGRYSEGTFRIDIARDVAQRFETNLAERNDLRMQRLVVAVLMHEIVHWGDARVGQYRGETPAIAFDRAVFNGRVVRYW